MPRRWPLLVYLLLTACSVAAFAMGGQFASAQLSEAQRARQLSELVQLALRRAEAAVDYGAAALADLAARGPLACDAVSQQAVRFHVYQRGSVKDIRLTSHNGDVRCSAYSETLEFDRAWVDRDDMLPAREAGLRLFRVDQFFGVALGVMRDIDAGTSLVAVLSVPAALLDVLPGALRENAEVVASLSGGETIAELRAETPLDLREAPVTARAASARYPLEVAIAIEPDAYFAWNTEANLPIVLLAAALGLVFGALLARALSRPESPVAEIDRGIAGHEFRPYLQPIVDLSTGAITGAEILARWIRADGTVMPPARFIKLAEETGRISEMTWQMLGTALNALREEMRRDKLFRLSVNIAPSQFTAPGFVAELRRVVSAARVAHRQIVVELTEREAYEDLERAAAIVAELRSFGFRVAIDDVGIGNSGLLQLQRLGADILKIDKFFVDTINRDATARSIVEMLVRLADRLGMMTVAEGIEEEIQVEALRDCGVTVGQGYLFSLPLPVPAFLDLVATRRPAAARDGEDSVSAA